MEQKDNFDGDEPFQVPNKVLPAGTYVMKLLDSPSDRHIVQIFNADETNCRPRFSQFQIIVFSRPAKPCSHSGKRLPDNRKL